MSVKETYRRAYKLYKECVDEQTDKYQWAANEIFNLVTYDGELDRLFVERICDVCKYIAADKTYEFINMSEENYITYILVCQLLSKNDWIEWGSSIRGAWFNGWEIECKEATPILDWWVSDFNGEEVFKVLFNADNLMALIEFIEEED